MKGHLTPTPVVNKNGVLTTVHKKLPTLGKPTALPPVELDAPKRDLKAEARERYLDPVRFSSFLRKYEQYQHLSDFMDIAEVVDYDGYENMEKERGMYVEDAESITELMLTGKIRASDVLEIEPFTLIANATYSDVIVQHLKYLKEGKLAYETAEEMKKLVDDAFYDTEGQVDAYLSVGGAFGIEGLEKIKEGGANAVFVATAMASDLIKEERSMEDRMSALAYAENLRTEYKATLRPDAVLYLHDAGIGVEEARKLLDTRLTTAQIAAIYEGDVQKSVSSGWL